MVVAEARWPESEHDLAPPPLPGFIVSSFSPMAAEAAARCLSRRPVGSAGASLTAVVIVSSRGDLHSAAHVAAAVDTGGPLGPLLFFQSVPNAVAGHIAARWSLTGPVVCVADRASALEAAALLVEDGDAEEALVLHVEQGARDHAHAVLLRAPSPGGQP
ncbi:beta-ketoacyl synthase chain length factor [Catenulispora yoronensis]|uniref:beta-ketoacyl synthase chain length factor n=1 Tax=Catenulispora yoronensis TaxID=450799 RepID=UPI00362E4CDF